MSPFSIDQINSIDITKFHHPSITFHKQDSSYWFYEKSNDAFPGQAFGLKIESILYHTKSQYQDILVFKSSNFGNVLVLNGIIQCTEKDEFAYQELITHLPIMAHPNAKKVLVIGGGDCGVIRELIKHTDTNTVESITMVEIDDMVIELSKRFLPQMSKYHSHEKLNIIIQDGFKFLHETKEKFDVIITDSSDPEGPAQEFFEINYFKLLQSCLRDDNGIIIAQSSENIWLNLEYLKSLKSKCEKVFDNVKYAQCYMPSYTSGQLGLLIATMNKDIDLTNPLRKFTKQEESKLFKYYSYQVHQSSFVLPTWANDYLNNE